MSKGKCACKMLNVFYLMDDIPRTFWYRVFEILPGALSWFFLIGPIIAAFWFPRAVAIFITIYVLLWFLRALKSSVFLIFSYYKSKRYEKIDWNNLLQSQKASDILHVVIIPTYKEEKEVLESSIDAIRHVNFPLERIILVLATEERDRLRAEANAAYLKALFGETFGDFFHFMHPKNLPDELPAKGANISYAGKQIAKILHDRGVDFSRVIVTTLDADNRPHPNYFSVLTYHYVTTPDREKRSFQPLAYFYNNIWEVPFANRLIGLTNTFWFLAESGESHHLFNASVYAQSLKTLAAMDFWSKHTIVEDLHQFWRAYFYFRGDHGVIPIFTPVYQDALQSKTYFTSLIGQYKQLRRWAWGASEIPYVIMKSWRERRHIPFFRTLSRFIYLSYLQVMWATAPIIILLNKSIPTVLNPKFSQSLFIYNLGQALDIFFTGMLIAILIFIWTSFFTLPRPPGGWSFRYVFQSMFQWILMPIVTIIYGAIPALDAQTRLMLNKPLTFQVTEKIRKTS